MFILTSVVILGLGFYFKENIGRIADALYICITEYLDAKFKEKHSR